MNDTRVDVRFEDPARPIPGNSADREAFAAALRAFPGHWALYGAHVSSAGSARQLAYAIRHGLGYRALTPAGDFEVEFRTLFGEHRIYIRYVGRTHREAESR
ncbi:hypothetical protein ACWGI0_00280 [Streptomyces sp. NPDC054802]